MAKTAFDEWLASEPSEKEVRDRYQNIINDTFPDDDGDHVDAAMAGMISDYARKKNYNIW